MTLPFAPTKDSPYNAGMADEKWLTTEQAADLSGYHRGHLLRLLEAGTIKGEKWGPTWKVDQASLLAHIESFQPNGKKRGPKTR